MFTRFQAESAIYLLDAPRIKISPNFPGAAFLGALGGAYEYEVEHPRTRLLRDVADLEGALQQSELKTRPDVGAFLLGLGAVTAFLNSIDEDAVRLYSYERAPSIDELLVAFAEGGGAADWALEELEARKEKGRRALLSVLKEKHDRSKTLAAISMLLIVFGDGQSTAAVEAFIEKCGTEIGKDASLLLAAYTGT